MAKSCLLKIATGSNLKYLKSDSVDYLNQLKNIQALIENDHSLINEKLSHPYSLIRLYAIECFEEAISKENNSDNLNLSNIDKKYYLYFPY